MYTDTLEDIGFMTSQELIDLEGKYGAHNYKPLPVVISSASGVDMYDVEGKHYFDFLSAYSAVNQGHCHPRLVKAIQDQANVLTLTSRAFYNDKLGPTEQYMAELFGYDKVLMMNSGAEAVETAVKLARRWGYDVKQIPVNKAIIVVAVNNFHGRTTGILSFSTDKFTRDRFGPTMPGFFMVPFDDTEALDEALKMPEVCGFLVEPMQGEAGVIVPQDGYLAKVREICTRHNVLFMTDEIQTGLARTGKMLAQDYDGVKGDILILGKALSGGMLPISAVLANDEIMLTIKPGEHGSTFGGNPLAAAVALEALKILVDENLAENAFRLGQIFRAKLETLIGTGIVTTVRGKGLLNAIKVYDNHNEHAGLELCKVMMKNGVLAKQTHRNIIRFAPPLVITESQLNEATDIIINSIREYEAHIADN
ncbi:MAG: ornithine--oxo-acid transaminase [Bacteroidota bacterium]|nr:ornithine--oxo-acid transaminase [Bacteroidota bacterium]